MRLVLQRNVWKHTVTNELCPSVETEVELSASVLHYLVKTGENQSQQWVLSLGQGVDANGTRRQYIVSKIVFDFRKQNPNYIGEKPYLLVIAVIKFLSGNGCGPKPQRLPGSSNTVYTVLLPTSRRGIGKGRSFWIYVLFQGIWKLLSGDFSNLSFPFLNNSRTKTLPHRVRSIRRPIRTWADCFLPSPYLERYSSQCPGDSCLLHTQRDTVLRVSLVPRNHKQSRWEHCSLVFRTSVTMMNVWPSCTLTQTYCSCSHNLKTKLWPKFPNTLHLSLGIKWLHTFIWNMLILYKVSRVQWLYLKKAFYIFSTEA